MMGKERKTLRFFFGGGNCERQALKFLPSVQVATHRQAYRIQRRRLFKSKIEFRAQR